MTSRTSVPTLLACALVSASAHAQSQLVDGDWSDAPRFPSAVDPSGDNTGAFDLTQVYTRVEGTRLTIAWDTGTDLHNTQSGDFTDGTIRIEIDLLDGRTITIDLRERRAFREDNTDITWFDLDYETMPTVASDRYETALDLALFLPTDGAPFTLNFSGSDTLASPIPLQTPAPVTPFDERDPARLPGTDVRIVSLNTLFGGFLDPGLDGQRIARLLDSVDPDIICFQEQLAPRDFTIPDRLAEIDPREDGRAWNVIEAGDTTTCSPYPLTLLYESSDHHAVLVDLGAGDDIVVFNTHPRCCGFVGSSSDFSRIADMQEKADQIAQIRAGNTPGVDPEAPIVVIGDWNLVGSNTPLDILTDPAGPALADWPIQNLAKRSITTWRSLNGLSFSPGRLDLGADDPTRLLRRNGYVLNTRDLSDDLLASMGLLPDDSRASDHLLLVADYGFFPAGDLTDDGRVDIEDLYATDDATIRDFLRRREAIEIR